MTWGEGQGGVSFEFCEKTNRRLETFGPVALSLLPQPKNRS